VIDESVRIERYVYTQLLGSARWDLELECCGLLAGRDGVISAVAPARNALQSATAYEIAPEELFAVFRRIREHNMEHLGIYHSHPRGDNFPSPTDIAQAYYPSLPYFIISPSLSAQNPVRAFRIADGVVRELRLKII
jgi:proteasome lid subunit RPN8/RPN11